jgi:HK97 family phage major capsid protein
MGDPLLDRLVQERDSKLNLIDTLKRATAERGGDLSDPDRETINLAKERIAAIDVQLDVIGDNLAMTDEARNRIARVSSAVKPAPSYRSAGEVLYDHLHYGEELSHNRLGHAMTRAAEHMGTDAASTVPVAGDRGGIVVRPVVGAVIDPYPQGMPFATALGLLTSTNAMHFLRPRIVDPNFATSVGPQGSGATLGFEKAELPSKKFDVEADAVSLKTVGTYLNISQQLIGLQPGSLDLIVAHLLRRLGVAIDSLLVDEMSNSTGTIDLPAAADAATIIAALYDASAMVYAATGELAEWIVMGPQGWARLGSLVDAAGRPLFPLIGPANAPGTSRATSWEGFAPAGLRSVVTPAITDDSFWVGNGLVMEGYIYRFPVLEAVEPSVLGRQVAVAAASAGYRPIPNGAVHLTDVP